jgi:hypothetical protein
MAKVVHSESGIHSFRGHDDPPTPDAMHFSAENEASVGLARFSDTPEVDVVRRWADAERFSKVGTRSLPEQVTGALMREHVHIARIAHTDAIAGRTGEEPPGPGPGPGPKPKPPPEKIAELVVNVKDVDGKPVEGADVTAAGGKKTDKNGVADFGKVAPGTYDVKAEKPGHGKKKFDKVEIDEKKAVSVPDGKKTVVNLVQHPQCANVALFEGPTTRNKYFGFDHKTNIIASANDEYWLPTPDKGTLTMPGSKFTRDAARWVSIAVDQEIELEIEFAFKPAECIPCIANTSFEVIPANIAEVVTKKVTAKKAAFKIKGKAVGEAALKVKCDGKDQGWFYIWCQNEATIKIDIGVIKTALAPNQAYSLAALTSHFTDIYRQAVLKVDTFDLGVIDLTAAPGLAAIEATGYGTGGQFLDKTTPAGNTGYSNKQAVLNALHAAATASLNARVAAPLPRAGAYRMYWYVPTGGCSILGTVLNIGSKISFGFAADSATARNSMAHEFGHSLNLRHPSDGSSAAHYAAHNRSTLNTAVPAYTATNTEPASAVDTASSNVMANDPTNLMGYWSDRPNRKPLRYHQWKIASRT